MQNLIEQVKTLNKSSKVGNTSLVFDVRLTTLSGQRSQLAKKQAKREMWSDQEFLTLIQMSVLGYSRSEMEKTFKRTTGKIFSKIQKHCHMLEKVSEKL